MKREPLVSVQILSYNHVEGLSRAINSVLRQKTTFEFEIIVHDDASSDGSQELLENFLNLYPGKFKLILRKENYFCRYGFCPIFKNVLELCTGKYIAMLECDDEWTDDNKLQMQVDLLEVHPEASLCSGGYIEERGEYRRIVYGRNEKLLLLESDSGSYFFFTQKEWSRRWLTKTLTLLCRKDALNRLYEESSQYRWLRDIHISYYLLLEGCGIYIMQVLGTYHICNNGMFGSKQRRKQRYQHAHCYWELWKNLRHPVLLRLFLDKILSFVFGAKFDGQLTIPG